MTKPGKHPLGACESRPWFGFARVARLSLLPTCTFGFAMALAAPAGATTTIRIGTLAPKHSSVGKIYAVWAKALDMKTNGRVELQVMWNGVAGPPQSMAEKLQKRTLDGADLDLAAMSHFHRDVFAVELPGVASSWRELDRVRAVVEPDLVAGLDRARLRFGWWEDVGITRLFTRGFVVHRPSDLGGKQIAATGLTGSVPLIEALHPGARAASVAPSTPSTVDAWFGPSREVTDRFDYVYEPPIGFVSFAMIFGRGGTIDSLVADEALIFEQIAIRASKALTSMFRATANQRISSSLKLVTYSTADLAEWDNVYFTVAKAVAQGPLGRDAINGVRAVRHLPPVPERVLQSELPPSRRARPSAFGPLL